ncbi:MAG: hypothetical protein WCE62_00150 [Polyangiales bacterium]
MNSELIPQSTSPDRSGFAVFAHGDAGVAHVMAHHLLDSRRYELGHRLLGAWLERHQEQGSCWTHLHWHMGVFEIALGRWDDALGRCERSILPVASSSFDALTDGPAMLWRLAIAAPRQVNLSWEPVRRTAARRLRVPSDPYVELHCLLALAGAGDLGALDRWLNARPMTEGPQARLLTRMGLGLRALAAGDDERAADVLAIAAPNVSLLGGSHAQNQLFSALAHLSRTRAGALAQAA